MCDLSQPVGDARRGFGRGDDRDDFEAHEILPVRDPLVQLRPVGALHDLVAASEVGRHPARDVGDPFRRESTAIAKTLVDGNRITLAVVLDDEKEHDDYRAETRKVSGTRMRWTCMAAL